MKWVRRTWYLCQLLGFCLSVLNLPLSALLCGSGTLQTTVLLYQLLLVGLCQWGNQRETTRLEEGEGTCSFPGGWDLLLVPVSLTSATLIHPFQGQSESRLHFPPHLQKQLDHTPLETRAPSCRGPRSHLHPPPLFPTSRGGSCFP